MIPSDWLETLAVFAEDPNLSRAARRRRLSQPAVHAQLRRLSELVGAPLYHRVGRGLALTADGALLASHARDAADRDREVVARLRGDAEDRRVVLAAGAGALVHVLGAGLRAFTAESRARLEIVAADAQAAVAAVARGAAHVGVAALDAAPEGVHAAKLTEAPQVLVAPRGHHLARRGAAKLAELDGERLVVPPPGRPQRAALDAAFAARGMSLAASATAVGWDVVLRLVELGVGLAIVNGTVRVPRALVSRSLSELPRVRYLVFSRPSPRRDAEALFRCLRQHGDAWRRR